MSISKSLTELQTIFDDNKLYRLFQEYCRQVLKIESDFKLEFTDDKASTKTYGHFVPSQNYILVYRGNRSMGDILRTVAHELVHVRQNELNLLGETSGEDGSPIENQANSIAGIILRKFGKKYPKIYQ
jgi:hypothetical protein